MDFQAMFRAELAAQRAAEAAAAAAPSAVVHPAPPLPPLIPLGLGISYCGGFLSPQEQAALTSAIDAIPQRDWALLPKRRLLNLGGVPHPSGAWAEPLPQPIAACVAAKLAALGAFPSEAPADQVLLNEYARGAGIGAHQDGPLYLPRAAIVSLGGDAVLRFSRDKKGAAAVASVVLRAGSLVVFEGEAYEELVHSIADAEADVVGPEALNAALAGCAVGDALRRPPRRLSLTLRRLAHVARRFGAFEVAEAEVEAERKRRTAWWLASISEKGE